MPLKFLDPFIAVVRDAREVGQLRADADDVGELGSGVGASTVYLVDQVDELVVVESDPRLAAELANLTPTTPSSPSIRGLCMPGSETAASRMCRRISARGSSGSVHAGRWDRLAELSTSTVTRRLSRHYAEMNRSARQRPCLARNDQSRSCLIGPVERPLS
ncbi:rRNA adenine N-6-methyltransferase family protein [Kribbella sp. VKM Ac-2566]|uniref:rRNA adenine N-6-methyltransferase family protein n=1 Tax=Kribbella sp. VKM Ac-2566 TaxID=2512218 RepID=UPI00106343AE